MEVNRKYDIKLPKVSDKEQLVKGIGTRGIETLDDISQLEASLEREVSGALLALARSLTKSP
jgi:hypothetical protein